jgi:N-acetylmuramoyl-L-alanine amidase
VPKASGGPTPGAADPRRAARRRQAGTRTVAIAGLAVAGMAAAVGIAAVISPSAHHGTRHPAILQTAHAAMHPDHDPAADSAGEPVDPAFFAPGACVAYPPTGGDTGKTVFLDAGHGGLDPGGVGYTSNGTQVREAPVNLRIELLAAAILRAHGYRVVVSRTGASSVARLGPGDVTGHLLTPAGVHADVAARDVCADKANAAILAGIYMNAGGGEGSLTAYDPDRPFATASRRLATLLQHSVLSRLNAAGLDIPDDGVVSDIGLGSALTAADTAYHHLLLLGPAKPGYFTTPSQMPGALIEPLYLTDPFEAAVASSPYGQHLIAAGIADAVEQYFTGSLPASRVLPTARPGPGRAPRRTRSRITITTLTTRDHCRSSETAGPGSPRQPPQRAAVIGCHEPGPPIHRLHGT